jgi:hypothetical protein
VGFVLRSVLFFTVYLDCCPVCVHSGQCQDSNKNKFAENGDIFIGFENFGCNFGMSGNFVVGFGISQYLGITTIINHKNKKFEYIFSSPGLKLTLLPCIYFVIRRQLRV